MKFIFVIVLVIVLVIVIITVLILVIVHEFYNKYSYSTSDMLFNLIKFGNQGGS